MRVGLTAHRRWWEAGGLWLLCLCACWANGAIRLTAYPAAAVADGASQILVTAEVRTAQGKPAPDGTQIAFNTTLGAFREPIVATEGGAARATLIASQLPGTATVTATAIGLGVVGETQVVFVATQEELRSATDYVQVLGADYLAYANEQRVIAASGKERGASVRFGFTRIEADDLQIEVDSLRVKARNAVLKFGSEHNEFAELSYELRSSQGFGLRQRENRWEMVKVRYGVVEPFDAVAPPELFHFADISESELVIKAAQIWFYPGERIQFHRAEFYVGEVKSLSLPLYSQSLWSGGVGSDTLVGLQNGQVYLDVPYYYTLTPTQIGALRLRTAQVGGRTMGAARGMFLDLEHEYRAGLGTGMVSLTSLARDDWGLNWRHQQPLSPSTRLALWLDSPAHQSVYGSAQVSHQARGYSTGLTLAGSTHWRGARAASVRSDLFIETTPRRVAGTPLRQSFSLNLTSNRTQSVLGTQNREGVGVRARWNLVPQSLGRATTLTGGLTVGRFVGNLPNEGWSLTGTLGITQALGTGGVLSLNYDYAQDALGASLIGRHRLSGSLSWSGNERYYLTGYFSRALDANSVSYVGDFSWRISALWRLGLGYTWQTYNQYDFRDQTVTIAYRIGYREVALTWSSFTKRWSVDLLTAFY
ncbi:MAG: Ig-like domain-containing protein [Fimbriimonadales bacterium]|nr:Ig-like domain-containing protein [Fimbriimonadales bacterium]